MKNENNTPMWVFLAFSSINSRRGALILIWCSVLFTLYCVPWSTFWEQNLLLGRLFLIDDWSWFVMMLPICVWYWLGFRWVERNQGW